jgi:hypothetical protein
MPRNLTAPRSKQTPHIPFSKEIETWKPELIAFLKKQRRYIRTRHIVDDWYTQYPSFAKNATCRGGRVNNLGHALGLILPVARKSSAMGNLYENVYCAEE